MASSTARFYTRQAFAIDRASENNERGGIRPMAINALQVAWISRLAAKGIIRSGDSMVEFSPQDVVASRRAVERYGLRHQTPEKVAGLLSKIFDGEKPRASGIPAFYTLFGVERYRSTDLLDSRVNWIRDFNHLVKLPERFRIATNFGTAEHIFDIGQMFRSMHDALVPGGVALYVLPTFGDINHGFYNIHPTLYFDLAEANRYVIDNFHYVDRWDIRNRALEADLSTDVDFDNMPIGARELEDRSLLQRRVTETFVANYHREDTQRYGQDFPAVLYDYCICALRKVNDAPFRMPIQQYYGGGAAAEAGDLPNAPVMMRLRARRSFLGRVLRAKLRRYIAPLNPIRARLQLRTRVKRLLGRA